MCFTLRKGVHKASIAKEDIVVFKGLKDIMGIIQSPYQYSRYTLGRTKTATLQRTRAIGSIDHGLHSCKRYSDVQYHGHHVYMAIIPRGSYYYENPREYVSNKLKVIGRVDYSGKLLNPNDGKRKKKVAVK